VNAPIRLHANQYEVGRDADTLDRAHDQLTLGVTGSSCSGQFSLVQSVRDVNVL